MTDGYVIDMCESVIYLKNDFKCKGYIFLMN